MCENTKLEIKLAVLKMNKIVAKKILLKKWSEDSTRTLMIKKEATITEQCYY